MSIINVIIDVDFQIFQAHKFLAKKVAKFSNFISSVNANASQRLNFVILQREKKPLYFLSN